MPYFYYTLKGKLQKGEDSWFGSWRFPPIWVDIIEAKDKKEVKDKIESDYGRNFPLRVLKQDLENNEFLLTIKELKSGDYLLRLIEVNKCKSCGREFKMIEKYQIGDTSGGYTYCSQDCYKKDAFDVPFMDSGYCSTHPAVIYKITNKKTNMCYIGMTVQCFTLRWYQHFFQGNDCKFHTAIKESKYSDWSFEVVEVIEFNDKLLTDTEKLRIIKTREDYFIQLYDSIKNGYNSVRSGDSEFKEDIFQSKLNKTES